MVETLCSSLHSEAPYGVVLPVGHTKQVSDDVAPVAELYRPATQSAQDSAAKVDEYFPASHAKQLMSPVKLKDPGTPPAYFPAAQLTQSEDEAPPLGFGL